MTPDDDLELDISTYNIQAIYRFEEISLILSSIFG